MVIYKRGREFELGTTENKSSKSPEWDSNLAPPDCESDSLTFLPHYLLLDPHPTAFIIKFHFIFKLFFYSFWPSKTPIPP